MAGVAGAGLVLVKLDWPAADASSCRSSRPCFSNLSVTRITFSIEQSESSDPRVTSESKVKSIKSGRDVISWSPILAFFVKVSRSNSEPLERFPVLDCVVGMRRKSSSGSTSAGTARRQSLSRRQVTLSIKGFGRRSPHPLKGLDHDCVASIAKGGVVTLGVTGAGAYVGRVAWCGKVACCSRSRGCRMFLVAAPCWERPNHGFCHPDSFVKGPFSCADRIISGLPCLNLRSCISYRRRLSLGLS